ncbi:MAG: hypothetical protein ACRDPC_28150 [Solirubrobacteraceae bacterium]
MPDLVAYGFPRDLDGHPLLAWMGEDWVSFVARELLAELRMQDAGTEMVGLACTGEPELATRVAGTAMTAVSLRIPLQLRLRDGARAERVIEGTGAFGGPDPRTVALEIATPEEHMIAVLNEARALLARPDGDFASSRWDDWREAARELDPYIERLRLGPISKAHLSDLLGPIQEVADSSGWGDDYADLASRFSQIRLIFRETWTCAECGADAGTIELDGGELRRETATGVLSRHLDPPVAVALADALEAGRADAVFAVDRELAPWWCPTCAGCYCGEHWVGGSCPRGHERMLAG